ERAASRASSGCVRCSGSGSSEESTSTGAIVTSLRDRVLSRARPGAVQPRLYRGWTMAAVGFVSVALVFGTTVGTLPFIYGAVVADLGWSLTEAALLFTYKNLASAVAALLLVGPLLQRFGLRRLMI